MTKQRIGYARVDNESELADLANQVADLRKAGAIKVVTNIGPMPEALDGLREAVGHLRVESSLIYRATCLHDFTIGDIDHVFAAIPEGTALVFFEPVAWIEGATAAELTAIRLCNATKGDLGGT
ncbi:hypothetical protein OO012_14990 [Rhodobacteraceae bacterium KMM 6894]|nr:hypothetical protein [Rhodobacteraceae bacterium KMM 6894]